MKTLTSKAFPKNLPDPDLGKGIDVHEPDMKLLVESIEKLREPWDAVVAH